MNPVCMRGRTRPEMRGTAVYSKVWSRDTGTPEAYTAPGGVFLPARGVRRSPPPAGHPGSEYLTRFVVIS